MVDLSKLNLPFVNQEGSRTMPKGIPNVLAKEEKREAAPKKAAEKEPEADGEHPAASIHERHQTEREDMHKRHRTERRDMHGNHRSEHDQMHSRHQGEHDAMAEKQMAEMQGEGGAQGAGANAEPVNPGDEGAAQAA